jgi:hypothetical protein
VNARDMTDQILSAWEEDETPTDEATEDAPAEEQEEEAVEETAAAEGEEPAEETGDDEPEEAAEAEDEEEPEEEVDAGGTQYETDDPAIKAYVAQYEGDPEKALKAATELVALMNRQGVEKNAAIARVQELERELEQAKTLQQPGPAFLSDEQRTWVEQAVESGNPRSYVSAAVREGEFELARAVCETLAEDQPYDAARLAQWVDQAEFYANQQQVETAAVEETAVDQGALMSVLVQHFPTMPEYEEQMVSALASLGPNHPLAQDARSNDPETAARGIIGIFEIARASTATVTAARAKVKQRERQAAEDARADSVVSSSQTSPAATETPRPVKLGPGLTMEELDKVWK